MADVTPINLEGAFTPAGEIVKERLPDLLRADADWYRTVWHRTSADVADAGAAEIERVWACLDSIRTIAIFKRDLACSRSDAAGAHDWGTLSNLIDKYMREPADKPCPRCGELRDPGERPDGCRDPDCPE